MLVQTNKDINAYVQGKGWEEGKGKLFSFLFKFPAPLFHPASPRRLHFKKQLGRPVDRETHCREVGERVFGK